MARKAIPLWKMTAELSKTAMGSVPADLIIRNGRLVNVCTGEIEEHTDVAVKNGRIALVGDASGLLQGAVEVIDAQGRYLAPGFIDGHLHVESSMITVSEYAKATIPHGTSAIFMDPHEIVNVLGLTGMKAMMQDGEATPLRVYVTTPSCVPASQGLENSGSIITADDIAATMEWDGVAGLGEMMDFNGILNGNEEAHRKVAVTLAAHKTVTGHFPLSDTGAMLNAYVASGISCCHESVRAQEALTKMRLGSYAMIREGSAWDDLPEVIRAVTENNIDTRFAVLVSDDLNADSLLTVGHMDHIIRLAIRHGVKPVVAIQMATINAANCFGLAMDIGSIAPGRFADINILDNLAEVKIALSIIGGEVVARDGALKTEILHYDYPAGFMNTVHIQKSLKPSDFDVAAPQNYKGVRVIEVHEGSVVTNQRAVKLHEQGGKLTAMPEIDICKVAVINRHHNPGQKCIGFVKGLGIKKGAVASTYAHDAHNLLIVGANDADMAFAANELVSCGGGMVAVENGKVLSLLELPVAGLLSTKSASEVAETLKELENAWRALGSTLVSPFMTMSLLSLSVIPEIRITDMGIVDVLSNKLTSLFID